MLSNKKEQNSKCYKRYHCNHKNYKKVSAKNKKKTDTRYAKRLTAVASV